MEEERSLKSDVSNFLHVLWPHHEDKPITHSVLKDLVGDSFDDLSDKEKDIVVQCIDKAKRKEHPQRLSRPKTSSPSNFSNWAGNIHSNVGRISSPRTLAKLQKLVKDAKKSGVRIRPIGDAHSWTNLFPDTGSWLVNMKYFRDVQYDSSSSTVTVGAGVTTGQLLKKLSKHKVALASDVTPTHVTYAGAVMTGSHGNGWDQQSLPDLVQELSYVNEEGEVVVASRYEMEEDEFNAVVMSLGLFGIVYELKIGVVKNTVLQVTNSKVDLDTFWADGAAYLKKQVVSNYATQFSYIPTTEGVLLETFAVSKKRRSRNFIQRIFADIGEWMNSVASQLVENDIVPDSALLARLYPVFFKLSYNSAPTGKSYASLREAAHFEAYDNDFKVGRVEYCFNIPEVNGDYDFSNVAEAFKRAKDIIDREAGAKAYPCTVGIQAKFVSGSDAVLSPSKGFSKCCFMSVTSAINATGWTTFQDELVTSWMEVEGARPHWPAFSPSLVSSTNRQMNEYVRTTYQDSIEEFNQAKKKLGGGGEIFLNDWLQDIFVDGHGLDKKRVLVIGAGLSGSSAAYWLGQEIGSRVEISMMERSDHIGGRIINGEIGGKMIEMGAEVGINDMQLFVQFLNTFDLPTQPPYGISNFGLWNGDKFVIRQTDSMLWTALQVIVRYGIYSPYAVAKMHTDVLNELGGAYSLIDNYTYDNFQDLIIDLGLGDLLNVTTDVYMADQNIRKLYIEELVAAIIRAFSKQSPAVYPAINGIVSQTMDFSALFAIKGGNNRVIEKQIQYSGAELRLNTTVNKVVKEDDETYTVTYTPEGSDSIEETFDYVILAAPYENCSDLELVNITEPEKREFVRIHQTWVVGELSPDYFKVKKGQVPGTILTVQKKGLPFKAIMYYGDYTSGEYKGLGLYKLFMTGGTTPPELVDAVFSVHKETKSYTWEYAFPSLSPQTPRPPSKLASRFYYPNCQESFFPTMEYSMVSSRNIVNMLENDIVGKVPLDAKRRRKRAPSKLGRNNKLKRSATSTTLMRHSQKTAEEREFDLSRELDTLGQPELMRIVHEKNLNIPTGSSVKHVVLEYYKKEFAKLSEGERNSLMEVDVSKGKDRAEDEAALSLETSQNLDVIVVGSGLSGLTVAYYLQKVGMNTVIVEADQQMGGRTRSLKLKTGDTVSIGGTWSIFENWATMDLANDVNCMPYQPALKYMWPQYICPTMILHPLFIVKLWFLGAYIFIKSGGKWWSHPLAYKYDNLSLEKYMDNHKLWSKKSKAAVREYFLNIENMAPIDSISALWGAIMVYIRIRDVIDITSLKHLIKGQYRWKFGTGTFVNAIASSYDSNKGKIYVDSAVMKVSQTDTEVTVVTHDKTTYTAPFCVNATAVNSGALTIRYDPHLPEYQSTLMQSVIGSQNAALNVILIYQTPWWVEEGVGVSILPEWSQAPSTGVFGQVMDLSGDVDGGHGIIRILSTPGRVAGFTEEQVVASAVTFLQQYYKKESHKVALTGYIGYEVYDWMQHMPYIAGVTYQWAPGSLLLYGDWMRTPFNRVHWAGSERAEYGFNWMEGAIERGRDVAAEIGNAAYSQGLITEQQNEQLQELKRKSKAQKKKKLSSPSASLTGELLRGVDDLLEAPHNLAGAYREFSSQVAHTGYTVLTDEEKKVHDALNFYVPEDTKAVVQVFIKRIRSEQKMKGFAVITMGEQKKVTSTFDHSHTTHYSCSDTLNFALSQTCCIVVCDRTAENPKGVPLATFNFDLTDLMELMATGTTEITQKSGKSGNTIKLVVQFSTRKAKHVFSSSDLSSSKIFQTGRLLKLAEHSFDAMLAPKEHKVSTHEGFISHIFHNLLSLGDDLP